MKIYNHCKISNHKVYLNNELLLSSINQEEPINTFLKSVYKHFEISYPKYFKMDNLSKLGFLATEVLLKKTPEINNYKPKNVGIIMANSNASLDTDIKYHNTIKDKNNYFPSPALFVYTLPNIVIGEIAIKHKFSGENAFFVGKSYDHDFIKNYVQILIENESIDAAIFGWCDVFEDNYEASIFFMGKELG